MEDGRGKAPGGWGGGDLGSGGVGGGFGLVGQGFEVAVEAGAGAFGHAVDEEGAVEVIDLVLDAAGEEAVADEVVGDAVLILVGDLDFVGAGDIAADVGEGKAALLIGVLFRREGFDHGVGDDHGHEEFAGRVGAVEFPVEVEVGEAEIDHAELEGLADLLSGEADALGVVHGLDHVKTELLKREIEGSDRCSLLAEDGLIEVNNGEDHGSEEEILWFGSQRGFATKGRQSNSRFFDVTS